MKTERVVKKELGEEKKAVPRDFGLVEVLDSDDEMEMPRQESLRAQAVAAALAQGDGVDPMDELDEKENSTM